MLQRQQLSEQTQSFEMGQGPEALLPLMLLEAQDCPEEHRGESAGGGQDGGGGPSGFQSSSPLTNERKVFE